MMLRSSAIRLGGLVSLSPCSRRFTTPRAWNVCTTGMPSGAAAASAARPDIQKWAWTTSGRDRLHDSVSRCANWSMWRSRRSLAMGLAGPASTCSTSTPGASCAWRGSVRSSRLVCTVTSAPRLAIAVDNAATCTF
jgi:hypothetical protein